MESIIIKCNGDIDEYHRLSKYVSYIFGNNNPWGISMLDISMYENKFVRDDNPVLYLPWHKADTKEKRSKFLNRVINYPVNQSFGAKTFYPSEYLLALYEDELTEVYDIAACVIQKHVRGVLIRNKYGVHNPHCEIGKKFLYNMYLKVFQEFL